MTRIVFSTFSYYNVFSTYCNAVHDNSMCVRNIFTNDTIYYYNYYHTGSLLHSIMLVGIILSKHVAKNLQQKPLQQKSDILATQAFVSYIQVCVMDDFF